MVGNGFGKLVGVTQVQELGEIETPILLTCTLCVWRAADAMVAWLLEQDGMEGVRSINPVVGETNDGGLNDIRSRPIRPEHVREALEPPHRAPWRRAWSGAGTGTQAFGWKGGIGTSSRVLPDALGATPWASWSSRISGVSCPWTGPPWGRSWAGTPSSALWRMQADAGTDPGSRGPGTDGNDDGRGIPDIDGGSIMMVVATDAPISARNLQRLASRALMGLARTGSSGSNGSGDYVLAFSSSPEVRRTPSQGPRAIQDLPNDAMAGPLPGHHRSHGRGHLQLSFEGHRCHRDGRQDGEALPIPETVEVLEEYGVIRD